MFLKIPGVKGRPGRRTQEIISARIEALSNQVEQEIWYWYLLKS